MALRHAPGLFFFSFAKVKSGGSFFSLSETLLVKVDLLFYTSMASSITIELSRCLISLIDFLLLSGSLLLPFTSEITFIDLRLSVPLSLKFSTG